MWHVSIGDMDVNEVDMVWSIHWLISENQLISHHSDVEQESRKPV